MKRFNYHFLLAFMLTFVMVISCNGNVPSMDEKDKNKKTPEEPAWKKDFVAISLNGKNIVGQKIDYELPVDKPDKPCKYVRIKIK